MREEAERVEALLAALNVLLAKKEAPAERVPTASLSDVYDALQRILRELDPTEEHQEDKE